jgi:hypothetical protein
MDEIRKALSENLVVQLWPAAGRALGLKRGATYRAASIGDIPTIKVGKKRPVPTSWLRQKLGLDGPAA